MPAADHIAMIQRKIQRDANRALALHFAADRELEKLAQAKRAADCVLDKRSNLFHVWMFKWGEISCREARMRVLAAGALGAAAVFASREREMRRKGKQIYVSGAHRV